MKVSEHLKQNVGRTLFSIEVLPPLKGRNVQEIFGAIDPLLEFDPKFIDVTYHREEYVFKKRPDGLLEKKSVRKRPGTVGICAAIMTKYGIDAVPHIICGGFSRDETENALIDLSFLGIDNVLVLRGDSIKSEGKFVLKGQEPSTCSLALPGGNVRGTFGRYSGGWRVSASSHK